MNTAIGQSCLRLGTFRSSFLGLLSAIPNRVDRIQRLAPELWSRSVETRSRPSPSTDGAASWGALSFAMYERTVIAAQKE